MQRPLSGRGPHGVVTMSHRSCIGDWRYRFRWLGHEAMLEAKVKSLELPVPQARHVYSLSFPKSTTRRCESVHSCGQSSFNTSRYEHFAPGGAWPLGLLLETSKSRLEVKSFRPHSAGAPSASCACNSLPGLKRIVLPEGIATSSPVRGLRPTPRLRGLTMKTPKPRSSIRSPRASASFIEWNSPSTACSAFNFGMPVSSARRLMISSLITDLASIRRSVRWRLSWKKSFL